MLRKDKNFCMRGWIAILVVVLTTTIASAEVITSCGASKGYSYFMPDKATKKAGGWEQDGISQGSLQLIRSGADFDIVYTDTIGTRSSRGDGFTILNVPQSKVGARLLVGVSPQGTVEHYLFQLDEQGNGTVVWGTVRGGAVFPKSTVMAASCERH